MADATQTVEIPCAKCGEGIAVDKALVPVGSTITMMHEQCTSAPLVMRRFKVTVTIHEIVEAQYDEDGVLVLDGGDLPVAGFGEEVQAASFALALNPLSESLGRLWVRVQEHAPLVDAAKDAPED